VLAGALHDVAGDHATTTCAAPTRHARVRHRHLGVLQRLQEIGAGRYLDDPIERLNEDVHVQFDAADESLLRPLIPQIESAECDVSRSVMER
jgi:hypothetical protein